jgi:hypothetical protein
MVLKPLGSGLLLAIALAGAAGAQDATRFDGQYIGELTLTGVISGDCSEPPLGALYPLTVSGGEVRFAYLPRFATTLVGRIAANGAFKATARLRRGIVQMTGRIQGTSVTASIVSPSCNYNFRTKG